MSATEVKTPRPVMGLYDKPMWESIRAGAMKLQCCKHCATWLYPPGPACPKCLSPELEWTPVSGEGKIASWVVFHRHYLPAYPPPYNAIAVRLVYVTMPDGLILPRWRYAG